MDKQHTHTHTRNKNCGRKNETALLKIGYDERMVLSKALFAEQKESINYEFIQTLSCTLSDWSLLDRSFAPLICQNILRIKKSTNFEIGMSRGCIEAENQHIQPFKLTI